jgi:hypothetical protein
MTVSSVRRSSLRIGDLLEGLEPALVKGANPVLVSDGAFSEDGSFHPLRTWNGEALMRLFRERVLPEAGERAGVKDAEALRSLLVGTAARWRSALLPPAVRPAILRLSEQLPQAGTVREE